MLTGSWSAAELPHRASDLRRGRAARGGCRVAPGNAADGLMIAARDTGTSVEVDATACCRCSGPFLAHFSNSLHCGDYVRLERHLHRRGQACGMPARDPDCVKTCTDQKSLESYS